jgi:hypothetical protein
MTDNIIQMTETMEQLKAELAAIAERSRQAFVAPRIAARVLVDRLGIPRSSLDNWSARGMFDLDADRHREGSKHRLYSIRDCIVLATAAHVSALGMPLGEAGELGRHLVDYVLQLMGTVRASAGGDRLVAYRRTGAEWQMIHFASEAGPGHVFKSGAWTRVQSIAKEIAELPPIRVEIDILEFVQRITDQVDSGITFVAGNADDFKNAAKRKRS